MKENGTGTSQGLDMHKPRIGMTKKKESKNTHKTSLSRKNSALRGQIRAGISKHLKYVFMDVVDYSKKHINNQIEIVSILNKIVRKALREVRVPRTSNILIPTGDGMCVGIVNIDDPFDIHLRLALSILRNLHEENRIAQEGNQFGLRIGINEEHDIIIKDINDSLNIAGKGITIAQRIMDYADRGTILVEDSVYKTLSGWREYEGKFRPFEIVLKHGNQIIVHQYIDKLDYLNSDKPKRIDTENQFRVKNLSHFKNLVAIAVADGKLEDDEQALLESAGERLGVSEVEIARNLTHRSDIKFIPPKLDIDRILQLYESVTMMCVDNEIDPKEKRTILNYAVKMGYSEEITHQVFEKLLSIYETINGPVKRLAGIVQ